MNKSHKKILEVVGLLNNNRLAYSTFSKNHILDIKKNLAR